MAAPRLTGRAKAAVKAAAKTLFMRGQHGDSAAAAKRLKISTSLMSYYLKRAERKAKKLTRRKAS